MAKLTDEDVLKLARLARLHLEPAEIEQFKTEINGIIDYVEQLHEADVDSVDPTYQVTGLTNVSRADELRDYKASPDELLSNAPALEDNQIKVRRMIQ